jgi:hypothetical protein
VVIWFRREAAAITPIGVRESCRLRQCAWWREDTHGRRSRHPRWHP